MFCARCGSHLGESAGFCNSCGTPAAGGVSPGGAAYGPATDSSTALVIGAIVCSVLALVLLPPVLGGLGIWLGSRVKKTNQGLGNGLMWFAGACLVAGMIFGALMFL
ncbi:MAG TPA: hypothetical protein VFO59_02075 [Dehalococcoidia bacterium]|nr:hypothetical protein [Dehalococcoidia bacterium]